MDIAGKTTPDSQSTGTAPSDGDRALEPLYEVSERAGLTPLANRLMEIRTWLSDDLTELESSIRTGSDLAEAGEYHDLATQAGTYLLGRPGKRIRPLCVMLGARLGGRPLDRQVKDLAVACEMVHAATLLHDDVIDEGTERRGAPAARMVFGNAASVLAGDHLLLHSLKLVEQVGYRRLLGQLLETITQMVTAEAIQLEQRGRFNPDRQVYLDIIQGKTAGLFRWALAAGGTVGGLSSDEVAALGHTGNALGLAFQLMDDVLDLQGDAATLGKDLFVDLREGKLTWPFIIGAERNPEVLTAVRAMVDAGNAEVDAGNAGQDPTPHVGRVMELLLATDAIEATKQFAREQGDAAREALLTLPDSPARKALEVVIGAAIERST
ncbi:MAG: octaprenyl-diphosphate synthase [Myxococcota bacterium]|jgi:octaprenyl-diphosphate synthase